MKKLIIVVTTVFGLSGIAFAQFMSNVNPPSCRPTDTLNCTKITYLGNITACDCVNPSTNVIDQAYSYTPTQVTSMENAETLRDSVVNQVSNAQSS